jgi:hypothetical protein
MYQKSGEKENLFLLKTPKKKEKKKHLFCGPNNNC